MLRVITENSHFKRFGCEPDYRAHIKIHKNTSNQVLPSKRKEGVHTDYDSSSKVPCENSDLPLHCKTCDVFFDSKKNFNIHLLKSKLRIIQVNNLRHNFIQLL